MGSFLFAEKTSGIMEVIFMSLKRQIQIFGKALKTTFCKNTAEDDFGEQLEEQFEQITDIARESNERSEMLLSRCEAASSILGGTLLDDLDEHMSTHELKIAMYKALAAIGGKEVDEEAIWFEETLQWMKDHENDEEES